MEMICGEDARDYLVWQARSDGTVEIVDIAVNSERRKGIGRGLVKELYRRMPVGTRTVYAFSRASNMVAYDFYRELRFRAVPIPSFYKDEPLENRKDYCDAILYIRDMGSQA